MELFGIENPPFTILIDPEEISEFKRIDPEYADTEKDSDDDEE